MEDNEREEETETETVRERERERETVGKELFVRLPGRSPLSCEIGQVSPTVLLPRRKIS